MFWVHPRLPFATIGFLHEALPVVSDTAGVQFVVEDAALALSTSIDDESVLETTVEAGNAVSVQVCRNRL